jgi:chemotaxis protein methyltransferase CheR
MPEEYRERFFSQKGDSYVLDESIKKMVEFRYFNLINEPYPVPETSGWDIIFCRNVTIYFQPESTRRVIHNFYQSLRDGGYLFTGFSESLRYLSDEFTLVQLGGVFLYQKKTDGPERKRAPKSRRVKRPRRRPREPVKKKRKVRPEPSRRDQEIREVWSRARELLEAGQPEQASELLMPYLGDKTAPEDMVLLQVEIALNQGDLEEAAQLGESVVNSDPLSVAARFLLGIVYRTMDDGEKAIAEFKRVVYLKPNHALARFYLGDLYSQAGQNEEAKLEYNNAVRLLNEGPDSFDERFAGGFSPTLLVDTCNSRLHTLNARR